MADSSRHSDDALVSKSLDLLWQQLLLLIAVAQLATTSPAPAPDGAVGGEGEAVSQSSRHCEDTLLSQSLDLLRQQLALPAAVAQPAFPFTAPAPDGAVGGEGEAVAARCRQATAPSAVMARLGALGLRPTQLRLPKPRPCWAAIDWRRP